MCGDPGVYGIAGEPLVTPPVWALLALRLNANRAENQMSLNWLLRVLPTLKTPASLALARICIETYGWSWPLPEASLSAFYDRHEFLRSVPVTAWTCLAWNPRPKLFANAAPGRP